MTVKMTLETFFLQKFQMVGIENLIYWSFQIVLQLTAQLLHLH